ncbi:hypothetical protein DMA12_35105 [Amycolatopsis balhimycina DSM 5908]|uniref:Uncharacterized protein n=1 Tax=Amycolatopsis balhimycina DSM 5908 TaxID=1081091 RepID=A0A428W427_AMYBA|nr:hypothetical protein DMA12_35105 [Amycolatopsis balhimycina DSM 5908]
MSTADRYDYDGRRNGLQVRFSTTVCRAGRYRDLGKAGMADQPSRPRTSPAQTPTRTERRIVKGGVLRR